MQACVAGQRVGLNGGCGAKYILGLMRKRWRYGPSIARQAHLQDAAEYPECPCRHPTPKECQAMETRYTWSQSAKRRSSILEISGPRMVATGDRVSPQKPRRNEPSHTCKHVLPGNGCILWNYSVSVSRRATSTARLRRSKSVPRSSTASQLLVYRAP